MVKRTEARASFPWVQVFVSPLNICVNLGKLLNLLQYLNVKNPPNKTVMYVVLFPLYKGENLG